MFDPFGGDDSFGAWLYNIQQGEEPMSDESRILDEVGKHLDQCEKMEVDVETALLLGDVSKAENITDGLLLRGKQLKESLTSLLIKNKDNGNYKQAKNMLDLIRFIDNFEAVITTVRNTFHSK